MWIYRALFVAAAWVALSGSAAADWVPPGFESLNEPQTTVIDIHYGGYYLQSTLATFNHNELTIDDPQGLVRSITDLKNPEQAVELLGNALALNTEHLCHSEFQLDCGSLQTDGISIIFDRSNLRAWLFINPGLLSVKGPSESRFLPRSSADLSFFNDSALFFSNSADQTSVNLANNTQIAFSENRLLFRSNLTDTDGLTVDTLALSREFRGKAFALGLLRGEGNNSRFANREHFVGASMQSSILTRTDLAQVQGTSIEVFLESRSRIEIFVDERLYSTEYYDVGNQVLNTASLPNGSYEVEVRITDASGATRTETRFFSKTALLPPSDQNMYFFQVGKIVEQNGFESQGEEGSSIVRAGYTWRLNDSTGVDMAVSFVDDSRLLEAGVFRQGRNYQLRAGIASESGGAVGFDADLRWVFDDVSINLNARKVVNGDPSSQLGQTASQLNSSVELPTRFGPMSLFYRSNSRADVFGSKSYGMRWRSGTKKFGGGSLNTSFEVSNNDGDSFAALTVNYRFGGRKRSTSLSPRMAREKNADTGSRTEIQGAVETRWQLAENGSRQLTLRADRYSQSAIEARYEMEGRHGAADVSARYNLDTSSPEIYGSLSTRVASTGDTFAIGGKRRSESAFLLDIKGVEEDVEFEVLVNGSPRATAKVGQTQLLPVAPYETYDIVLRAKGNDIINLDTRSYKKTVYPGNVIALSWEAKKLVVAHGRIVANDGSPIANALIKNAIGLATTDSDGYFQAEIDPASSELLVQKSGQVCAADLPRVDSAATLVAVGSLDCAAE